ncbi:bifunctional hydroxyethylthiazole kinase/thiamine-phosphate diphosphorylase [Starmerella bacillaris]|uniref:Bifunctional hydroxyethylthiazole kinase/thiamine-phosphate diphosphorylase n=1 Tax=Starmerella bacillaris TaxID=1247836 RepID=A0AAV5RFB7_STABA|nr:bifunctional hydroxyethylthiazole kinase/thiamine-phosphate diphosphorylase [Starmerella bacillaris]
MSHIESTWRSVERIRSDSPVVHCITNTVAANFAANAVIAVGGSPIMASEGLEIDQVVKIASSFTVNIGTCSPTQIAAVEKALDNLPSGIPWVLDPVGVAATTYRQEVCQRLLKSYTPQVIKGNASEIISLAKCMNVWSPKETLQNRGVDSTVTTKAALPAARALAKKIGTVVAISGAIDFIVDSQRTVRICNGHPLMAAITASGCALTAVLGAFLANSTDIFWSTVHALSYFAVAGQLAAAEAEGTGSMHSKLLDYLYKTTYEQYYNTARPLFDLSLYLVTDPHLNLGRSTADIVKDAVEAGVTIVQLREKDCETGEFIQRALAVKKVCDAHNVPFVINDRVDVALAVDASGVHIGQGDIPVPLARKLLGENKIIGLSVSTDHELELSRKYEHLVDYIGVGPVNPTKTKTNAKKSVGLDGLRQRAADSDSLVVAIGGIKQEQVQEILEIDEVSGIAVVTAITMAEDVTAATKALLRK